MRRMLAILAANIVGAIAFTAVAQECQPKWLRGDALPGADGEVLAVASWDSDGPGGQPPKLVVGGSFSNVANLPQSAIAFYDTQSGQWSSPGTWTYPAGSVYALAPVTGGDLYVGGYFTKAGGVAAMNVARWNGQSWSSLGSGLDKMAYTLLVLPNGDLIAGGTFQFAGGISAKGVARWNGSEWSAMGDGLTRLSTDTVRALAILPNGDIIAGGVFSSSNGSPANYLARWDGQSWTPVGGGTNNYVYSLGVLPNGDLVAGGTFTKAGSLSASYVARWDGANWNTVGDPGLGSVCYSLCVLPDGRLLASTGSIRVWDGASWSRLGYGINGRVNSMVLMPDGLLAFGGSFEYVNGGTPAQNIATVRNDTWRATASGFNDRVEALVSLADGRVVAGGWFTGLGNVPAQRIAQWNGATWSTLGIGMSGPVYAVVQLPNGDIVAGGMFYEADKKSAGNIARWDGHTWNSMGSIGVVEALAVCANGDLIAATTGVVRWNGTSWATIGVMEPYANTYATLALPDGRIVAGGAFHYISSVPANYIAIYDGGTWQPLGTGFDAPVYALALAPNGDILAAGRFTNAGGQPANRVARWDGTSWHALGAGIDEPYSSVFSLLAFNTGDILAAGNFSAIGSMPASCIARWDGNAWLPLGSGLGYSFSAGTLASRDGHEVLVGGHFLYAGDNASAYFARWDCRCLADFNEDHFVNGSDYDDFAAVFDTGDVAADVNADGFVNADDFDAFADAFQLGC